MSNFEENETDNAQQNDEALNKSKRLYYEWLAWEMFSVLQVQKWNIHA